MVRNKMIGVVINNDNPIAALREVESLGFRHCHLYAPAINWHSGLLLSKIKDEIARIRIVVAAIICALESEDYSSIEAVKRTVGLVNISMRDKRINWTFSCSSFAKELNVAVIQGHLGFIPERNTSEYESLIKDVQKIADYLHKNGQFFALETGQESGTEMLQLIEDVDRNNVKVNFDPANFLIYNSDNPIDALEVLKDYIVGVHCKDARRPERAGMLGVEVPLGEGEVGIPVFLAKLKEIGYTGPLTIEREIGDEDQWKKDVLNARRILESLI